MIKTYVAPYINEALEQFKIIVKAHAENGGREGKRLVVFCEDRLSLAAERAVCAATGGTFSVSVYTLSRFLSVERGRQADILSDKGAAMVIAGLIEKNRKELQLFKRLSSAGAAQDVYDTIALLYSSKVSYKDLAGVEAKSSLLARKLHDLELLYREYFAYLEESGAIDRNVYLRSLPDVIASSQRIKGADVAILGFRAFTSSVADCVRACMRTADNVYGLFVGGSEKKYVNEAWSMFYAIGEECAKAALTPPVRCTSSLIPAAEHLRKHLLEPESYFNCSLDIPRGMVNVVSAADEDEECEFIAAAIVKRVREENIRYREISVMHPDLNAFQPVLERVFGEYGIPYYVDRRYPLSSHGSCDFLINYLTCAADGCAQRSVISVVMSPLFAFESEDEDGDKDVFVNYLLRACPGRGAIKRAPNAAVCEASSISLAAVERVRLAFLEGLNLLPAAKASGAEITAALRKLLELFNTSARLQDMASVAEGNGFSSIAEMSARANGEILKVLAEAEKLTAGEKYTLREFIKILKSGFAAAQVSLIPPKQDAVFVGDISECANTGSKILFAAGLTEAVPRASMDTAILTDMELTSLEKLKIAISPKISLVNRRVREITALNICAFSEGLYLTYPVLCGGESAAASEIITYACRLLSVEGAPLSSVSAADMARRSDYFTYFNFNAERALRLVEDYLGGGNGDEKQTAAICKYLSDIGVDVREKPRVEKFDCRALYGDSVSPTAIEAYYSCPYMAFAARGLKLEERREEAFRPLEAGNFIHAALQKTAEKIEEFKSEEECAGYAKACAEELISTPAYAVTEAESSAKYSANALCEEAAAIATGMWRQLASSRFKVEAQEEACVLLLSCGAVVRGRIDRIDSCGDMVRVIDYKTGHIDDAPSSYYMGLKLQLPLYLTAAAKGRRAAGAYYFPANIEYSSDGDTSFALKGFMDGGADVVSCSDTTLQDGEKSRFFGAYLNGKKLDKAMEKEEFASFLSYSVKMAEGGAEGLRGGDIAPSPIDGECQFCKFKGCCGYDIESGGVREKESASCAVIAEIMGGVEENDGD